MGSLPAMPLHPSHYLHLARRALREDLADAGDVTTEACIPESARSRANVVVRGEGVVAGMDVAEATFRLVDESLEMERLVEDGMQTVPGTIVATVSGSSRSILTAERTALNFLGRVSGVATATARLVAEVEGTGTVITDTRKTLPGLRALDKYGVRMGGGRNHRFGLHDAVMVKDNHIAAAGGIGAAVTAVRSRIGHTVKIEVEVDSLEQLEELLEVGADVVLLDNMDIRTLRAAVERVAGRMVCEASGGATLDTVRAIAETGVDVISAGWITHSAPQLDVALDFV